MEPTTGTVIGFIIVVLVLGYIGYRIYQSKTGGSGPLTGGHRGGGGDKPRNKRQ